MPVVVIDAAPFEARPDELRALVLSLNHPVVSLAPLPNGPAAAAIAIHDSGVALLAVRSQRTGAVAFLAPGGRNAAGAFERAMACAEGLGFLFEEEGLPAAGTVDPAAWPGWLREIFCEGAGGAPEPEREFSQDVSGWLSKFRWARLQSA